MIGSGGGGPVQNCKSMTRWTSVRRNAQAIRSDGKWNKIWVTRASNPHSRGERGKEGGERGGEERKNEVKTRERKEKRKKKEAA